MSRSLIERRLLLPQEDAHSDGRQNVAGGRHTSIQAGERLVCWNIH